MNIKDFLVSGIYRGDTWVKVVALIRKNETGETREEKTELCWLDDEPSTFIWEDGNYGCDCNRHIFFNNKKYGEKDWDCPCGEGKYSVNIKNPKNGEIFYREYGD